MWCPTSRSSFYTKFYILLWIYVVSCRGVVPSDDTLMIATAANMQYPIIDICNSFEISTGVKCQIIIGSTGKLTAQILSGAPFDVLIAADTSYPALLFQKNIATSPRVYAFGKLVLWSEVEGQDLRIDQSAIPLTIAYANPKTAPYGLAALQVLSTPEISSVPHRLIMAESVQQVNQFILTKSVDVGLTGQSVLFESLVSSSGNWRYVDESLYTPIAQAAVGMLSDTSRQVHIKAFLDHLHSTSARSILSRYGYGLVEQ